MTAELFKKAFDKYYSFPISFWDAFACLGEEVSIKNEQVLKESNKTENHLYFILKGSGGILLWNENKFICTDLVLEGDFFCDYLSFITRKPTPYEVLTFEKSTLLKITHSDLVSLMDTHEYGDMFWRYAVEALYIDKHLQHIQAFTKTAAEIYKLMLSHQPEIIKRIPQKYIASYLGITPQSLSRIRSEL